MPIINAQARFGQIGGHGAAPGIKLKITAGEGWRFQLPRTLIWEYPTTEVSPVIAFSPIKAGETYHIYGHVQKFSEQAPGGTCVLRVGGETIQLTLTIADQGNPFSWQGVAEASHDKIEFTIGDNSTVSSVVLTNFRINHIEVP